MAKHPVSNPTRDYLPSRRHGQFTATPLHERQHNKACPCMSDPTTANVTDDVTLGHKGQTLPSKEHPMSDPTRSWGERINEYLDKATVSTTPAPLTCPCHGIGITSCPWHQRTPMSDPTRPCPTCSGTRRCQRCDGAGFIDADGKPAALSTTPAPRAPSTAQIAETFHDALCTVSHHDRPEVYRAAMGHEQPCRVKFSTIAASLEGAPHE